MRVIFEIQRVKYDHYFDRFLNYFIISVAEKQRNSICLLKKMLNLPLSATEHRETFLH
jgi:hypothetical protein